MTSSEQFEALSRYPFAADPVFQAGLQSVVESVAGQPDEVVVNTIERAKVFYYSTTMGETIDYEEYFKWRESQPQSTSTPLNVSIGHEISPLHHSTSTSVASAPVSPIAPGIDGAPAPISFTQLADLISSGQTHLIPNNEVIPSLINDQLPSESRAQIRRKPWEHATSVADIPRMDHDPMRT